MCQVFAELLDPIIKERHNGYDPRTMKHPTDLDSSKVSDHHDNTHSRLPLWFLQLRDET